MPRKFLLDVGHDGAGFAGAGLADRTSSRAGTGVPDRSFIPHPSADSR